MNRTPFRKDIDLSSKSIQSPLIATTIVLGFYFLTEITPCKWDDASFIGFAFHQSKAQQKDDQKTCACERTIIKPASMIIQQEEVRLPQAKTSIKCDENHNVKSHEDISPQVNPTLQRYHLQISIKCDENHNVKSHTIWGVTGCNLKYYSIIYMLTAYNSFLVSYTFIINFSFCLFGQYGVVSFVMNAYGIPWLWKSTSQQSCLTS